LKSYKLLFVDKAEKEYLQNLVTTTDWNIKKACSQSGFIFRMFFTGGFEMIPGKIHTDLYRKMFGI